MDVKIVFDNGREIVASFACTDNEEEFDNVVNFLQGVSTKGMYIKGRAAFDPKKIVYIEWL
jgi:hypothetical protein